MFINILKTLQLNVYQRMLTSVIRPSSFGPLPSLDAKSITCMESTTGDSMHVRDVKRVRIRTTSSRTFVDRDLHVHQLPLLWTCELQCTQWVRWVSMYCTDIILTYHSCRLSIWLAWLSLQLNTTNQCPTHRRPNLDYGHRCIASYPVLKYFV